MLLIPLTIVAQELDRPKLVVGIVVDQMRWDYLYRFTDQYTETGFKRLLSDGFSCENTYINHLPSFTAVGHTVIYTGSVPAITGIVGNSWYNRTQHQKVYCAADSAVTTVGSDSDEGKMSPRNMFCTTIGDQLRLATNFKSKVVGVSLKDRAAILPAGHNPTGAFWYDTKSGNFITSTYYMDELPGWVSNFNAKKYPEKLMEKGWKPLLSKDKYKKSAADDSPWEGLLEEGSKPVFPYDTKKLFAKDKGVIHTTPFGNTLTLNFAEAAIEGYRLGQSDETDMLTINLAATDYAGHLFGINSIEIEDVYIRLDRDLSDFINYLDNRIGRGNYLLFLTADHGGAHSAGFMEANKLVGGISISDKELKKSLNGELKKAFAIDNLVLTVMNDEVYFDRDKIKKQNIDFGKVAETAANYLKNIPEVLYAVIEENAGSASVQAVIREKIVNGYNYQRSGDIRIIPKDGYLPSYCTTGTTHGKWNSYDTHIPLIFFGKNITAGKSNKQFYMNDIAPTIAAYLNIEAPSGCVGKVITPVLGE
ncbi:MAG: alkaline phosphatase family protein [Dysgonamonadaceae bacterium]|nr:alkaline phosphatase family protein [Dysgonamonadaceae bacterium]